jgi:HD-GYP domain-containing protein (c-di-GMP phosphodiesterase class II)
VASGASSAALDHDVSSLIEQARAGSARRARASSVTGLLLGAAFLAVAAALVIALPAQAEPGPWVVVVLVLAYAIASRVYFEVSFGSAFSTQLVLVPMLFLLPVAWVPLAVAAGFFLARLTRQPQGPHGFVSVYVPLFNAFHALGPALVLGFALSAHPRPDWGDWPIYVAALAAQFALDYVVSALRGWFVYGVTPRAQARSIFVAYLVDATLAPIGLAIAFIAFDRPAAFLLVLPLLGLLGYLSRERRVRIDHALELGHAYRGTALLLGDVVEADDAYTGHHSREVVSLVLMVCDRLGLRPFERQQAEFTALLHDVGKIRIPNEILNKPGPLTRGERGLIELHTVDGQQMLEKVGGVLGDVGRLVRSCHEHWDGNGYPDGIAGEQIPLVSRIVGACDAFNAMTTDRPYRAGMSTTDALAELIRCSGSQFDPRVVTAIVALVGEQRLAA